MGTIKSRRRLAGCLVAAAILGVSGVVAGTAPQASAQQALSQGCTLLNEPSRDGVYGGASLGAQYLAGEVITVSAGEPTIGAPTATQITDNMVGVVASGGFPATLSYTVPADGGRGVGWAVSGGVATWNVSCTPPVCTITGTANGDALVGTAGPDVICGLGGGDSIDGLGGNDIVFGGDGGDSIRGGPGLDRLLGEGDSDSIDARDGVPGDVVIGGAGSDSLAGDPGDSVTQ